MAMVAARPAETSSKPVVIAVASGKGGVGKTNVSVNTAAALAAMGKRVLLFDADLGLANANVLLGIQPEFTIEHVLNDRCAIADAIHAGPYGMGIVPGTRGVGELTGLSATTRRQIIDAFDPVAGNYDYLVVDTAAGISDDVTCFVAASDYALIVISPEPAAFMDAYALMKLLHLEVGCTRFLAVTNMVDHEAAGRDLFHRFEQVAKRFLDVGLYHMGSIPNDQRIREAVLQRQCVVHRFPASAATLSFRRLAHAVETHVSSHPVTRATGFFQERHRDACAA